MLSGDRLVFWALNLSDFVRSEQVEQKLNAGVKHPENPVLAPRPGHWDGTRCKVYGTVFYDREDSMLKMWYSGSEDTPDSIRREYGSYRHVGYAVSPDGVHWDRPNLGLIEYRGSKENNIIVLNAQAPSVFKGLDCPGIDSAYVMFTQAGQDTVETRVLFSDDGARWAVRKDNATGKGEWGVKSHEPFSILYDPDEPKPDFRWKGYSLVHVFRNGYRGRAVGFYHGATPFEWTEWERQPIMDTSFALESEIHIPHVTRFHDDYVMLYDAMEPWHDTQTEIALSRDGIGFERVRNGVPIVTRGRPDQHDAAKVCVSPRSLFVHDGKIWWYYTTSANNYQTCPRSGRAEPWYRYTCLAQWRQDGFAHLQTTAGGRSAMVETIPFELLSDDLDVRFNVLSPSPMKVEFLDETGRKLAVGRLPAGDSLSEPVAWDGEPKVGRGTTARLRFHLNGPKARFYSVSVAGAKRASCGVRRLVAAVELDCRIVKQMKFTRAGRSGVEPP
ncbi:MAG: hypothetical protein Q7T82_06585, partial [Armatimonadota bacterium]|nr:hypothetical protein [Armatimonadota bacterium]